MTKLSQTNTAYLQISRLDVLNCRSDPKLFYRFDLCTCRRFFMFSNLFLIAHKEGAKNEKIQGYY